jgi:hypothetical protein
MRRPPIAALARVLALLVVAAQSQDERVFSGPQPGEKLAPLRVQGVYDTDAGKELDFLTQAADKPVLLIFVHGVTRPSIGLTRLLSKYAESRAKDGLAAYVVWLAADRGQAEQYLKQARQSLGLRVPVGISLDGAEGPGSYGLNRNVTLTILVGRAGKVTANFALVQPALTDAPKILGEVVKLIGGKPPTLADLDVPPQTDLARPKAKEKRPGIEDTALRELLRAIINKDADEAAVKRAAAAVEEYVVSDAAKQRQLGDAARLILSLKYGTPAAQQQLRAWADKYPAAAPEKKPDKKTNE